MADLTTNYLGLTLKSPIVVSSNPLTYEVDNLRRMEEAGAGAVVLYSLFEEQIELAEMGFSGYYVQHREELPEALRHVADMKEYNQGAGSYLAHIYQVKHATTMPIIASLNGDDSSGRRRHARLREAAINAMEITAMVFMILIGAAVFSLVFRGFGGEELIHHFFASLPGGATSATLVVMLVIFLLGFILDFIEITFVVVPIVGPILLTMGVDPLWLGIMIAMNLQTSFLTPPFGFALFYLRGVAPPEVTTGAIYRGVIPFILIQILAMAVLWFWPALATWLPALLKQ